MVSKKDERDHPAEATQKSEPPSIKHSTGGSRSTLTEKPLKRSVLEEPRHNAQAPAEKKPKNEDPTNLAKDITPATISGGDQLSVTQQLPQPESSQAHARACPAPSDKSEPDSNALDVHARAANYWRNVAMQLSRRPLGVGSPQYSRPLDPTDNELYIFVTALRSCLSLPERSINGQDILIMGDYLMQRGILVRLKKRADYAAIMRDINLAPKLAALEQIALQTVVGYLHKGLEEGKITPQDIARWKLGNRPQRQSTTGHEPGKR